MLTLAYGSSFTQRAIQQSSLSSQSAIDLPLQICSTKPQMRGQREITSITWQLDTRDWR